MCNESKVCKSAGQGGSFATSAAYAILALTALGLAAALYWLDPASCAWYPRCPLHMLTGWQCAGCGALRATHALLHGNLLGALRLNPLFVLSLPFMPLLLLRRSVALSLRAALVMVALLLLYTIVRNLM